jgi:hypothetical protein
MPGSRSQTISQDRDLFVECDVVHPQHVNPGSDGQAMNHPGSHFPAIHIALQDRSNKSFARSSHEDGSVENMETFQVAQ